MLVMVAMVLPATALADDGQPHLILTMVCTIYTDDVAAGLDILNINLGQYASDCSIDSQYVVGTATAATMSADVSIPGGALYPECGPEDCFDPFSISVQPGTSVTWTNDDTVLHTVTGNEEHPDGKFDRMINSGDKFSFTFDTPGTYEYGCIVHPWAKGVVVVSEDAGQNADLAQKTVDDLITLYDESGTDAFEEINASADPNVAVAGFVIDADTFEVVAHGQNTAFLGFRVDTLLEKAFIPIDTMIEIIQQEDGVWLSYPYPDTSGNILGYERGWFKQVDNYVFGARYSISDEERAQSIAQEMIRIYDLDPKEAIETINSFLSVDSNYPFVVNLETTKIVAHGANPDRVGMIAVILTNSTVPLEEFEALDEDEGVWAEYVFYNPEIGQDQPKRSWLIKHDGLIFGSGYYP